MANVPKIKNIRVRQVDNGGTVGYKVVVVVKGDDADEVANVDAALTPASTESPAPNPSNVVCIFKAENSAKNKKRYVNNTITFASDALDSDYSVTATMKKANGATIGTPVTTVTAVEDKDDDETPGTAVIGSATITQTRAGSGFQYLLSVIVQNDTNNEVSDVTVLITTPVGAPQATPTTPAVCAFAANVPAGKEYTNNTVQFASDPLAGSYTYSLLVTMRDSTGATVGSALTLPVSVVAG